MKSKEKKPSFTIVELLVVMSIIIILIGLLLPSLNAVRRFAKDVTQKSQFHDITNGLELFKIDFDDEYPDSSRYDVYGGDYCGAMKLCEAMVGKDKLGFHVESEFTETTGVMASGQPHYYQSPLPPVPTPPQMENLAKRQAPYVNPDVVQTATMQEVYGSGNTGAFDPCQCVVICDVYGRQRGGPRKLGMPVLYYKADTTKMFHDTTLTLATGSADCCDVETFIYNFCDNVDLTALWAYGQTEEHPIYLKPIEFYINTKNPDATIMEKPYNEGFHILLSAGHDGLYGTRDDVYNFVD